MIIKFFMFLISLLASFPAAALGTFYFFDQTSIFWALVVGIILTFIIISILRTIFRVQRPSVRSFKGGLFGHSMSRGKLLRFRRYLHEIEKRSFASAHVARVAVFIAVLYLAGYSYSWTVTLLLFMILIGLARLYLKRHRFIDIITGAIVGLFSGYVGVYISNMFFL